MALHIVIGYDSAGNGGTPVNVYTGRCGTTANEAMKTSDCARFEVFHNPRGIRKHNDRPAPKAPPASIESIESIPSPPPASRKKS